MRRLIINICIKIIRLLSPKIEMDNISTTTDKEPVLPSLFDIPIIVDENVHSNKMLIVNRKAFEDLSKIVFKPEAPQCKDK